MSGQHLAVTPETMLFGFIKLDVPQSESSAVPLLGEDCRPVLNADEEILWEGEARLFCSAHRRKIWEFPTDAHVMLTSERLAYVCRKFDTGNMWYSGWIVSEPAVVLTAISKTRAALRRRGTVAGGQVMHAWIGRTDHRRLPHKMTLMKGLTYTKKLNYALKVPTGKEDHYIDLTVVGEGNETRTLSMRIAGDSIGLAELFVKTVAQHRIDHDESNAITAQALTTLRNLAVAPLDHAKTESDSPNRLSWPLPASTRVPGLSPLPSATQTNRAPAVPGTASWLPDPTGRHELRYWDGKDWTEHVSDRQQVTSDPLTAP